MWRVRADPERSTLLRASIHLYGVGRGSVLCHGCAVAGLAIKGRGEDAAGRADVWAETNLEEEKKKKEEKTESGVLSFIF